MAAPPVLVSFAVTRKCNLMCPHCYSEALETPHPRELSTTEALELISDIAGLGARMIIFDGGEPTLREDLPRLVRRAAEEGLAPLLGTNGMSDTLTESYLQELKEAGLRAIAVSLDGARPETHDEFRGVGGAWEKTLQGIKNINRVGIPFQVGTVLSKKNADEFPAIVDLAKNLGANAVEVFDFVEAGRGAEHRELELSHKERRDIIQYIIRRQLEEDDIYFRVIAVPSFWPEVERSVKDDLSLLKFVRTCCGAGIRYATILYDGTAFPCMLLPVPLGNVREKPFSEIWRESEVLKTLRDSGNLKGRCGRCRYKDVCRGARCRAYAKTGDMLAEDPACWLEDEWIEGG